MTDKPNIVFIHVDQMQYAAIRAHGCLHTDTPAIDAFVAGGISFALSYSANPVCCPARTSWYTGRMSSEHGVTSNFGKLGKSFPDLGQWLSKHGYECYYGGKWHVPGRRVDESFKIMAGSGNGEQYDAALGFQAEAFLLSRLSRPGAAPFFLNLGFLNPHDIGPATYSPACKYEFASVVADRLPPLPPSYDRNRQELGDETRVRYMMYVYYRLVEMVDRELGRVFRVIANSALAANTLVIFTADHGEMLAAHNRIRKGQPYEEAARVPLVVSFPGVVKSGVSDREHLVSGVDITATILDYAGAPAMPGMTFARSLRPLLEGKPAPWREYVATETSSGSVMIRTQTHKYVASAAGDEFYDLAGDPGEMKNLSADAASAESIAKHKQLLAEYRSTIDILPELRNGWRVKKARGGEDE